MRARIICLTLILMLLVTVALSTACSLQTLDAPTELVYEDGVLSWSKVPHADRYVVEIDGVEVAEVRGNYYDYVTAVSATFRVAAVSDAKRYTRSPFSAALAYRPAEDTRTALSAPSVYEVNGAGVVGWSYVAGATGYRIYVNSNVVATVGTVTHYTLTDLGSGVYTVQVQAVGGGDYRDSARSAVYRMEVADGKVRPPMISAPSVTFVSALKRLEWAAVAHAVSYRVYQNDVLVETIMVGDPLYRVDGAAERYFYAPTVNVRNTEIYVVAVADNESYADSNHSAALTFPLAADAVPTGLSVTVEADHAVLSWDALRNCSGYRVHVEKDGAVFGDNLVDGNSTHFILPDGTYAVSVAGDGDGYIFSPTEYSAEIEITFVGGTLLPVVLDTPQDAYLLEKTVYFGAVPHATSYQVFISTPYDDEVGDYTYYTDTPQFSLPVLLYKTVLYVYVRALGGSGYAAGLWSNGICYYPRNDDPDVVDNYDGDIEKYDDPNYVAPEPAPKFPDYSALTVPGVALVVDNTVRWGETPGADHYELVADGVTIATTSLTYAIQDVTSSHVYKVRAVVTGGDVLDSPYTAEVTYAYTRLEPPANLHLTQHTLRWDLVAGASAYVVEIDGEAHTVAANSLDLEPILSYDGVYTVRVRALSAVAWRGDSLYSNSVRYVVDYERSGTMHKPYVLSEASDLTLLQTYPTAWFALVADIDVGDVAPLFYAQNAFGGGIEGNGHSLYNIRLSAMDSLTNGLFGCLYGATLSNITFEFVEVSMNEVYRQGVLAAEAVQSVFDHVTVRAAATGSRTFGTVGKSSGCTYAHCAVDVTYIQSTATAVLGGLVGDSKQDTFTDCAVEGSLAGGIYCGALMGVADGSAVTACAVGAASPFAYTVRDAYAGAVGSGSLSSCDVVTHAVFTLEGNCFAGGFGGRMNCSAIMGESTAVFAAACGTLHVGGAVGVGAVDMVDVCADMTLTGSADVLYAGGVMGYAQGLCVCSDATTVTLAVDFAATEGNYLGGVVGFGSATYEGAATGDIIISATVSVGRVAGIAPTTSETGWQVADKE